MSFEEFVSSCSRTFGQTPIRYVRLSSPLSIYVGAPDQSYRPQYLLCQGHFTSKSISIAFYLHGTSFFEYLTEDKIRQRLQLLNNVSRRSINREQIEILLQRLKHMFTTDGTRDEKNQCHAKLLSADLLSIEIYQNDQKFKFRCDSRPELFSQHYLRQLLIQVKELSRRQNYLCELLENKDQLIHFDAQSFLSTPLTFVDENEDDEDEEEEMFSSSTTDRLVKSAFARRGIEEFLNVCLLQKAFMKTFESIPDDDDDDDEISSTLNKILDRICQNEDEDEDELDLAARIAKRRLISNDSRQIKRFRSLDM